MRALLEGYAVVAGSGQIDAERLSRMEDLVREMRRCRLPDDVPRLIRIDLEFHELLVASARSERLMTLWGSLNGQIGALFITGLEHRGADIFDIGVLHQELIEVLRSGDMTAAQEAIVQHYVVGVPDEVLTRSAVRQTAQFLTAVETHATGLS